MKELTHSQIDKNIAIRVDSLTKIYPLYNSPRDRLKEALHPRRKKYHTDFYALKDVSFQVQKGDSLGIVGQNGSGKSTLLKILSRVLTPSTGEFDIHGRVISLLELGSGFNPELTGIENIYFYGTILGFSKKKIESKLDEILAFADIGQFVRQPLRTYSSGMKSRLAFAVASNVDPDILILDEVLAVGDLRFKQKCLRTMRDIIDQKRTVILVSHDTSAVTNFCNKSLWLNEGNVQEFGPSNEVVKRYVGFMTYGLETQAKKVEPAKQIVSLSSGSDNSQQEKTLELSIKDIKWTDVSKLESFGEYGAIIEKVALYFKGTDKRVDTIRGGEWLSLYVMVRVGENIDSPGMGIRLKDKRGNAIFTVNNYLYNKPLRSFNAGEAIVILSEFKFPLLMVGKYTVTIALSDGDQTNHTQQHWIHDALIVEVQNEDPKYKRGDNIIVIEPSNYSVKTV
jgi:ABC-type polysaccharide/polyol phosphate transport system ATPase subunit